MKRPTPTKRGACETVKNGLLFSARTKQALLTSSISKPTSAHTTSATRSTSSRKTKAKVLKAGLTSGVQVATPARTTATQHSGASTAHQARHSSINDQSPQRAGDPYRAISPFTGGQLEATNARGRKIFTVDSSPADTFSTTSLPLHAGACPKPTDLDILRWKLTPFTLESVGDYFYCPRLIVDPETALSQILSPASYPLNSAVTLIHQQASLGKSLPCEAARVLTVYDELHRLDFSGTLFTFLDPELFDSLEYSPMEQKAFNRKVGDWIDLLGLEIGVNGEIWHLDFVDVDYTQFGILLWLSKGSHQVVHALPLHGADPPRRQRPLQRYQNSGIDSSTAQQMNLHPAMLEDIVFCHYWMKEDCNSEDICMVLMWRNNGYQLEPHDIDLLGCQIFGGRLYDRGSELIRWLERLTEEEKQRLKDRFWEDLALAQQANFCWRPWVRRATDS